MSLDKSLAEIAIRKLDKALVDGDMGNMTLIIGGGGAMILAHKFLGKTKDIDAVPRGRSSLDELDATVKDIARELKLDGDWLNPYFSTFMHYLPQDYGGRLIEVYSGKLLKVISLGAEELLIMKFMAGRDKDTKHIRHLIKAGADLSIVEDRLLELQKAKTAKSKEAVELYYEVCEEMGL